MRLWLSADRVQAWAPAHDTLQLCQTLGLDTLNRPGDLMREIVLTLLMGPVAFEFPSLDELVSAVRIRRNIVQAARKTTLAFHTSALDRPQDCWTYDEDRGFTIRPGVSLIAALTKATQPEVSGSLYSFSCYRATEYVILLGIAQELQQSNPALLQQLQTMWTARPIVSGEFHEVFLREQGSMEEPCRRAISCRATAPGFAIPMKPPPMPRVLKVRGSCTWAAACSTTSGSRPALHPDAQMRGDLPLAPWALPR